MAPAVAAATEPPAKLGDRVRRDPGFKSDHLTYFSNRPRSFERRVKELGVPTLFFSHSDTTTKTVGLDPRMPTGGWGMGGGEFVSEPSYQLPPQENVYIGE